MTGPHQMFPGAGDESPVRRIAAAIRANPGPLALAAGLLAAARVSEIATFDPQIPGLTAAATAEVALTIAAHALATLTGCWAVLSGGRPAGFRGLAALPPGRLRPFLGFAVVFNLWFLVLSAVLSRAVLALADGGAGAALAAGAVTTGAALLIYIQLGFVFPDVLRTGESGIFFAMALGVAGAGRVARALALPLGALVLPHAVLAAWLRDARGTEAATGAIAAALPLAVLATAGAAACAVAMTALYRDMTRQLPDGAWR